MAQRLFISKDKTEFVFCFRDGDDLHRLRGGRGEFILYSPEDYTVGADRQVWCGPRDQAEEALR